jgi:ABC-2 type transport system ATP-binding protein
VWLQRSFRLLQFRVDGRGLEVAVIDGPRALQQVLAALGDAGIRLHDAGMRRPTLDDVFLKLTGHKADKAAAAADDAELEKAK